MRHALVITVVALIGSSLAFAQTENGPNRDGEEASSASGLTCDTTYDGLPNGDWRDADNWTNGVPGPTPWPATPTT